MMQHPRHTAQRAFTLIEMVVVLVLLGLAMAAIFPSIGNMLRGSARSAALSQATGDAGIVAQLLENDIKTALGDRGTGERTDSSNFSGTNAIRLATIPSLDAGVSSTNYSDIVVAGPTELQLNADVYERVGVERVTWLLRTDDAACGDRSDAGQNWCLQRTVQAPGGGAIITIEVVVKGRGTYPATTSCASGLNTMVRVFCYQEAYPGNGTPNFYRYRNWTSNCTKSWTVGPNGGSPNQNRITVTSGGSRITTQHNAVDALTSISRLDRIVVVGATLLAGGAYGNAGERSYENIEIAVRARENEAYREAIMCGARAGWGR